MTSEWDLTRLCNGFDDPKIEESINFAVNRANELENKYKGKIKDLTPSGIAEMINLSEEISINTSDVNQFARLSVAADTNNMDALKLVNRLQVVNTKISKQLTFMELELGELLLNNEKILEDEAVSDIKYYLEKIVKRQRYRLSEREEQIILEKNQTGINEWSKLQSQWLSNKKFSITINNETKDYSWPQGVSLLSNPDKKIRREAVNKLFTGLEQDRDIYAFALRNVCTDTITEYKRRGYPSYMEASFTFSNIEQNMFDAMFKVVEQNVDMFQEFLLMKAKILGTDKLDGEDLYAPPPFKDNREISWDEATQMIKNGYFEFDNRFGEIATDMIDNKRIDSKIRPGKRGGAFCSTSYNHKSAYILQSFSGTMGNVKTLAHEMGHAVHAYLSTEKNRILNISAGMSLAESASEFGTMLFTDKFLKEAPDADAKKAILFEAINSLMIVIFEVASRTKIEQNLYMALDNGEYLSPDKINELFWKGRDVFFGDAVNWRAEQVYEWAFKGHYYIPGLRFYNYPYVFGELLVLSMYNNYRKEGAPFVAKFKEYLSAGGSKSASDLAAIFGFDLTSEEFWQNGINEIKRMFDEFKSMM